MRLNYRGHRVQLDRAWISGWIMAVWPTSRYLALPGWHGVGSTFKNILRWIVTIWNAVFAVNGYKSIGHGLKKRTPARKKTGNIDQIDGIENEFCLAATYFFQREWQCPPAPQPWDLKPKTGRGGSFSTRPESCPGRCQGCFNDAGRRLAGRRWDCNRGPKKNRPVGSDFSTGP